MKGIFISPDLCIGCYACSNVCERGIARLEETKEFRKIIVSGFCPEECESCKDVCPTEAIKVIENPIPSQEIVFRLTPCRRCGIPTAPERMLDFISRRMNQPLFELDLCITCRQQLTWDVIRKS
ncbi:MAG: 4Fe-4S binding protein [Thermodesulforhabdaceae bacterium]